MDNEDFGLCVEILIFGVLLLLMICWLLNILGVK
jgi:hypothetical protein